MQDLRRNVKTNFFSLINDEIEKGEYKRAIEIGERNMTSLDDFAITGLMFAYYCNGDYHKVEEVSERLQKLNRYAIEVLALTKNICKSYDETISLIEKNILNSSKIMFDCYIEACSKASNDISICEKNKEQIERYKQDKQSYTDKIIKFGLMAHESKLLSLFGYEVLIAKCIEAKQFDISANIWNGYIEKFNSENVAFESDELIKKPELDEVTINNVIFSDISLKRYSDAVNVGEFSLRLNIKSPKIYENIIASLKAINELPETSFKTRILNLKKMDLYSQDLRSLSSASKNRCLLSRGRTALF